MTTADTRQLWTKIHRWLGLAALAFLFVAGVTGSVLCFDKRIDAHLNSDLFYRQANAAPRPLPQVAADVQARYPELVVTQFPLNVGPSETLKLDVSPSAGSGRL